LRAFEIDSGQTEMKRKQTEASEPLGIVIADGGHADEPTRFSAFVWGPGPDDVEAQWEAEERELELVHN
jgi:hypothetical protein